MAAVDDKALNESRPSGIGPGERLQAARIQKGLSLDDVAARMHLSERILEAIEENDFEEITAPIFVKGYLRAYARIVSLDEDEMIQQYVDYYSEEDPPISSTSNTIPELSIADARIRWTTYLVVVALAVLLAAWWWNKEQSDEPTISLDAQSSSAQQGELAAVEAGASEIEASSEVIAEVSETIEANEPVEEAIQPAPVESQAQIETAAGETAGGESASEEPAAAEPADVDPVAATESAAMQPAESVEPVAEEVAAIEAEPVQSGGLIAPSGSDKLRITVIADTWADIKDSSDYQMVYDLLRADQSLELTGAAPFSVFLGNGHGVEIEINGEAFDFTSRIRDDNTARLKINR
jgi:cytoskeleton protein RodZ